MTEQRLQSPGQFVTQFLGDKERLINVIMPLAREHGKVWGYAPFSPLHLNQAKVHRIAIAMVLEGLLAYATARPAAGSIRLQFLSVLELVQNGSLGSTEFLLLLSSVSTLYEAERDTFGASSEAAPFSDIQAIPGRMIIRWSWVVTIADNFLKHEGKALRKLRDE